MKRFFVIVAILVFIVGLSSCVPKKEEFVEPVSFYYCNDISSKDDFEHIFVPEQREGAEYLDNKPALLSLYLKGPESEGLVSPFPADLSVVSVQHDNSHVHIVLSDHLANLTGLDLSIACTCLSMTVLELYDCDAVEISAEHKLLDEQKSIVFTADILILSDDNHVIATDS